MIIPVKDTWMFILIRIFLRAGMEMALAVSANASNSFSFNPVSDFSSIIIPGYFPSLGISSIS